MNQVPPSPRVSH
jgi:hypothetical protein